MLDHADDWRFHRLQIEEAMQNIGDPRKLSLDEFIGKSQDYTARLFQIALERARRNKAIGAGGIFHFFAIDIWPSVTMAAVDFYRVPMKVHSTVARSFQPLLASVEYDRDTWKAGETMQCPVWLINDRWTAFQSLELRWRIEGDGPGASGRMAGLRAEADSARQAGTIEWKTAAALEALDGDLGQRAETLGKPDGIQRPVTPGRQSRPCNQTFTKRAGYDRDIPSCPKRHPSHPIIARIFFAISTCVWPH